MFCKSDIIRLYLIYYMILLEFALVPGGNIPWLGEDR